MGDLGCGEGCCGVGPSYASIVCFCVLCFFPHAPLLACRTCQAKYVLELSLEEAKAKLAEEQKQSKASIKALTTQVTCAQQLDASIKVCDCGLGTRVTMSHSVCTRACVQLDACK